MDVVCENNSWSSPLIWVLPLKSATRTDGLDDRHVLPPRIVLESERSKLGVCALVQELREVDIDGSPLLFHAASGRREHSCFRTAYDLVYTVLGKGGLMEQVEAVDGLGRGLLMHAARSNHVQIFSEIFDICEKNAALMIPSSRVDPIAAATTALSEFVRDTSRHPDVCENCRNHAFSAAQADVVRKVLEKTDHVGMNCLHHAAEAGCSDVLTKVIDKSHSVDEMYRCVVQRTCQEGCLDKILAGTLSTVGWENASFFKSMNDADKSASARTPIMYVLRNMGCGSECTDGDTRILQEKFYALYEALQFGPVVSSGEHTRIGWMATTSVPPPPPSVSRRSSAAKDGVTPRARAVTELLHAARGGLASLELALNEPLPASMVDDDGSSRTVNLDDALCVEVSTDGVRWTSTEATKTWGRALILAAAAKRGDEDALYHVLFAIKVSFSSNLSK